MPILGEVKRDYEIGKGSKSNKWVWIGCNECGRTRWVQLITNKPAYTRCRSCASKNYRHLPETRHKISNALLRERSPRWKGGIRIARGYVMIYKPEHPRSSNWGYVKRSILVLENKLGREIAKGYDVHHLNRVKDDDRPANLCELEHKNHGILSLSKI